MAAAVRRDGRRSAHRLLSPIPICSGGGGASDLTSDEPSQYATRFEGRVVDGGYPAVLRSAGSSSRTEAAHRRSKQRDRAKQA